MRLYKVAGHQFEKYGGLPVRNLETERNARYTELCKALEAHGCAYRTDSRLCQTYVEHGIGNVKDIIDMMLEMKFFFTYTNYASIRSAILNRIANECHGFIDREAASEEAKVCAVREWKKTHQPSDCEIFPQRFLNV